MIDPPVDAEAVLLFLHAPFAPTVVQGALFERVHGAPALVLGLQTGHRAEVALFAAGHALPHGAVLSAARLLFQTLLTGSHAIHPGGPDAQVLLGRRQHVWKYGRH